MLSRTYTELTDLTPAEAAGRLRHLPGLVFFDSALPDSRGAEQTSIVAAAPSAVIEGRWPEDAPALEAAIQSRSSRSRFDDGLPHGFAAGVIEYQGRFRFGIYERALFYKHHTGEWFDLGGLAGELSTEAVPPPGLLTHCSEFRPLLSEEAFCERVRRVQAYIAAGDIYQANLANRFDSPWPDSPEWRDLAFGLYLSLREASPAPYGAYIADEARAILSASPELFLKITGREIRTRPIKGTRPRFADHLADERSAYDLLTSPKEISELVMITDLERSDLGRVSENGSVRVTELLALERYAQVFHLVSTVEGMLRPGLTHLDVMRACFPGGSITGAPKKRACEIIEELEPVARGVYTGAIGWFGFNGESQFSIAIRTMTIEPGRAYFHAGAGIVADSIPEMEWRETLHKAAGLIRAAEEFQKGR